LADWKETRSHRIRPPGLLKLKRGFGIDSMRHFAFLKGLFQKGKVCLFGKGIGRALGRSLEVEQNHRIRQVTELEGLKVIMGVKLQAMVGLMVLQLFKVLGQVAHQRRTSIDLLITYVLIL